MIGDYRTTASAEALYGVRTARRRRRCDGHLNPERHWILPGQTYVASALPPDSEIGNTRWWHIYLCLDCAPEEHLP